MFSIAWNDLRYGKLKLEIIILSHSIPFHTKGFPKLTGFLHDTQDVAQAISTLGAGKMRDIGGCGGDCPDPISAGWARYLLVPTDLPCPLACASLPAGT